jgi:HK97 family phage major capsid protein
MKTVKELKEELLDLHDSAKAILNIAEKESRDLSADEQADYDKLAAEDTGSIDLKLKELETAEKRDRERKSLALARARSLESGIGGATIETSGDAKKDFGNARHIMLPTRAFTGADADKKAYACGHWLRALVANMRGRRDEQSEAVIAKHGWDIRATATEGSASGGGYLVPDPLSAAFIEYRQQVSVIRKLADVHVMTADTLAVPKLTSGQTIYYPGESNAITASDMAWGQVGLTAVKRAALGYISQELKDDAIINIVDQVVSRMAYEFAKQEDNEAINGDGTPTYGGETGILAAMGAGGVATAATGHDTWPEIDAADVAAWMAKLPSQHFVNPAFVCSMAFYHSVLFRLQIAGGGNDMSSLAAGVGVTNANARFLGYPVYFTDRMPTATAAATVCALFGNFQEAVILGDRMSLTFAISDQYAFNTDLLAVRGTTRYDWNVHNVGDASNAGAVVALKTAS